MAKVLFITPKEVKRKSIIDGNTDDDKLVQFIETAQDVHIQGYLGTKLYKKLMELCQTNDIEDSEYANYKDLLDEYISPMLVWYTQCTYIPFAPYKISNKGMSKEADQDSDSIDSKDIDRILGEANNLAEFYSKRFVDYMCENSSLFPEYNQSGDGGMEASEEVNYTGWNLSRWYE